MITLPLSGASPPLPVATGGEAIHITPDAAFDAMIISMRLRQKADSAAGSAASQDAT